MSCPDVDALRSFADLPSSSSEAADVRAHVLACAACARRVELARREEAALRAAVVAEPPKDLLARTLAAVSVEAGPSAGRRPSEGRIPARRRARPGRSGGSWGVAAVGVALGVGALAWALASPPGTGAGTGEEPAASPGGSTRATPTPGRGGKGSSSGGSAPPAASPSPSPRTSATPSRPVPGETPAPADPDVVVRGDPTPEPTPTPLAEPAPGPPRGEDPPRPGDPLPGATPGTAPRAPEKALARVRSGKLTAAGKSLGPGDPLPEGAPCEVAPGGATLVSEGAVELVVAARARIAVSARAERVALTLERGQALARSLPGGSPRYLLETADAAVTPLGTELVLAVESGRTRLTVLEGQVRAAVVKVDATCDVRAGFEVELVRGKAPAAPRPFGGAKALAWLPAGDRPKALPAVPELLRAFSFEDGAEGWKGTLVAGGARGTRGALRGVGGAPDYAVYVEVENLGGLATIEPDLWLEATCRVDRRTRVTLQLWDATSKENLALLATLEPGTWQTLAAPLRALTDPSGKPRGPVVRGGRGTCLQVLAGAPGETVELLVDEVRFFRQS